MLQIFVNLPREKQGDAPFALALPPQDVPVVILPGAKVRVPLGAFGGQRSPLNPPTEVQLLDITLEAGAELSVPVPAGHTAFVLPIFGRLTVNDQLAESDGAPVPVMTAGPDAQVIRLQATQGPAKVVLFAGEPLDQPVYWQGPMALASPEALVNAMTAYRRGDFGRL
jgi:redox-sensitive bicupin YhaK (pirin superfamily)